MKQLLYVRFTNTSLEHKLLDRELVACSKKAKKQKKLIHSVLVMISVSSSLVDKNQISNRHSQLCLGQSKNQSRYFMFLHEKSDCCEIGPDELSRSISNGSIFQFGGRTSYNLLFLSKP